jgi:hypothetical protein
MSDISEDALFELAEKSITLGLGTWDTGQVSDGDDDCADDDACSMLVRLRDGRWHACRGVQCPYVQQSSEGDRLYTCTLSGRVLGVAHEQAHDSSWTGRSITSADPDMLSGASGGASVWKAKRNAFSASAAAYAAASKMTMEDISFSADCDYEAQKPNERHEDAAGKDAQDAKRGAPCVIDVDEEAVNEQKRNKALRRIESLRDKAVQIRLMSDASNVVVKLFSVVGGQKPIAVSKANHAVSGASVTLRDPRLENYDFVLNMALKRYASMCNQQRCAPTISGVHDVCIAANQFVKERRRESDDRTANASSSRKIAINGITVDLCAQLVFTLWCAMCTTPHFVGHQTGDSFRPFAAGVMYALKRGLRLPNNMVLVPAIEEIASQLPTLRSSTATSAAKQLQQASHRGLCAIQRGLASIDTMSPEEQQVAIKQLKNVSSVAARLRRFVNDHSEVR